MIQLCVYIHCYSLDSHVSMETPASDLHAVHSFFQLLWLNSQMTVEVINPEILHILLLVHNRKNISHLLLTSANVSAHLGKLLSTIVYNLNNYWLYMSL